MRVGAIAAAAPRPLGAALLCALLAACAVEDPGPQPQAGGVAVDAAASEEGARAVWPPLDDEAPPPLPVEDLATVNYYVLLDGSGSMLARGCSGETNKIRAAVAALERFVATVPADANLGLATFDSDGIGERVALARDNREQFGSALARVRASGGTPLLSSIELAERQLTVQAQRQLGYGEYHLVIVTDGQPDPPREDPTPAVRRILAETPIVVHTIGFCIGSDHVLNQPGRTFYLAADSPEDLARGLGAVLAEAPSFDVASFTN